MTEELKKQIEKLHEDPMYMYILESMGDLEETESNFAEMYIQQESPFVEIDSEM